MGPSTPSQYQEAEHLQSLLRSEEKRLGLSISQCLEESHPLMQRLRSKEWPNLDGRYYCCKDIGFYDAATLRFLPKFMKALEAIGYRAVKDMDLGSR
jgi:hypothetical protein